MRCLIANRRSDTPAPLYAQAAASHTAASAREAEAVAGPAIFAEWLAAHGRDPHGPSARLAAIAGFAGLVPELGWAGNLRASRSGRIAIRRGAEAWSHRGLANSTAAWLAAAGERAEGDYDSLVRVVADHLLCADTRPDDTLVWAGDPADPWPFGALIIGATLVLRPRRTGPHGP